MCGIAGKLSFTAEPVSKTLIQSMCGAISHRGPDDWGMYVSGLVGIGNRRLSIIDVQGGHQPISNENATIWTVFNGEIYNFPELREDLVRRGHRFRTHSDTEVIVHLYEEYGVDCLQYINGMFSFALWDEPRRRLFLARDRLGEKPLIYSLRADGLTFASEIQAVLCDPYVPKSLDLQALDLYLAWLYIPAPWTIFEAVRKLPPAHYLICEAGKTRVERYWQVEFARGVYSQAEDARGFVRELLMDSVRRRLVSEVPLGAFLSGGIDSSTIVALMSQVSSEPIRTFAVGFEADEIESRDLVFARLVAERFGTRHQELWVRPQMADVLGKLVRHFGEPFGDGSAIPTYYISQAARQHVTVVLTGDGGDELFGGYDWYTGFATFNARREAVQTWSNATQRSVGYLRSGDFRSVLGAVKGAGKWTCQLCKMAADPVFRYGQMTSYFRGELRQHIYTPEVWRALMGVDPLQILYNHAKDVTCGTDLERIFYLDHTTYLPDDILMKTDTASMACSLETRPPFLDHRLVELAAALPVHFKINGQQTKVLLRQVVADLLPPEIMRRPKVGFGLPIGQWMRRGELYELANDLLQDRTFRQRGVFDSETVSELLRAHRQSEANYGQHLFMLLVFELWARALVDTVSQGTRE